MIKSTVKSTRLRGEEEIPAILNELRGDSDLTIKELASRSQISEQSIYRWKKVFSTKRSGKVSLRRFISVGVAESTSAYVAEANFFAEVKDKAVRFY